MRRISRDRKSGLLVEKIFPSGAYQVSGLADGVLVTRTYFYFTKQEAISAFIRESMSHSAEDN